MSMFVFGTTVVRGSTKDRSSDFGKAYLMSVIIVASGVKWTL